MRIGGSLVNMGAVKCVFIARDKLKFYGHQLGIYGLLIASCLEFYTGTERHLVSTQGETKINEIYVNWDNFCMHEMLHRGGAYPNHTYSGPKGS